MAEEKFIPWFKFNATEWLMDPMLSMCSLETQGAWIRLMCYMHNNITDYGYLSFKSKPYSNSMLSKFLNISEEKIETILNELLEFDIINFDEEKKSYFCEKLINSNSNFKRDIVVNKGIYEDVINKTIEYFNKITQSIISLDDSNFSLKIISLIQKGYGFSEFKAVIDIKSQEWLNDPSMAKFLRANTLFGDKFTTYLNENKEYVRKFKSGAERSEDGNVKSGAKEKIEELRKNKEIAK